MRLENVPDIHSVSRERKFHVRLAAFFAGVTAVDAVFEPFTTYPANVVGGIGIALGAGGAAWQTWEFFKARGGEVQEPKSSRTQFQYNQQGFSDRYNAEVEYLAHRVAQRFEDAGITELHIIDIDPLTRSDVVQQISSELFETRLAEGYELSMHQMCAGLYGAAQTLGIAK